MRHSGPRTLIQNGISCTIWAEDALEHYGVPTSVFDLFCLVEDTELAADCLRSHGFTSLGESTRIGFQFMPELIRGRPRLTDRPDQVHDEAITTAAVVLLPTSSWRYPVEALSLDTSNLYPDLSLLLQGLIDGWLDAQDISFRAHIGIHIAYLYHHVPQIRDPSFASSIPPDYHREFHLEYLENPVRDPRRQHFRAKRDGTN